MIDQAREWLEWLHVSNAPEADMALDLLGRLDEAEETVSADSYDALLGKIDALTAQLSELEEALGADGPEEAIAMARTLREAFE